MNKALFIKKLLFLFVIFPLVALAQQITGTVTDGSTSTPLIGANVIIKGTSTGTTSDFDGNYSIKAENFPVTLEFSSLGFETMEKVVTSAQTVNVTLAESATSLEEVVITGLATSIKRSNAANAVASVSAEDLAGRTPPSTLDGALAGKFAGALVTKSSGAPGGGISVKLRGITSINGNSQPLYIIDGVYVSNRSISGAGLNFVSGASGGGNASSQDNPSNRIADLNPDDIANIEVLKGASAAAIYGARGAAGVVIITTKKGKRGSTKVSIKQDVGFNEIIRYRGQRQYTEAIAENAFGAGQGALFLAAQANGTLVDYEREIYGEKGFNNNTSVNVSGGSDSTLFYAAFSNNEEDGIVRNTGYDRKSVRFNAEHKFFDNKAKISVNSNYVNSEGDRGFFNNDNTGTTIGVSLTSTPSWAQLAPDANGNYPDNPYGSSNPIQTRDLITNREQINRFITGGTLDLDIFRTDNSSLKAQLRAGVDYFQLVNTAIFPRELQFQKESNGGRDGVSAVGTSENRDANYSAFLIHNYNTEQDLSLTTQLGATKQSFSLNTIRNVASDLIASETNLDQAANIQVSQNRLEQEDIGFFIQEEINYQDKLIGTLGVRGDKSSNNGDANELFYYPKGSLAVNLNEFDFWGEERAMNQFKIRGAYGEAGNFPPNGALYTVYEGTLIGGLPGVVTPVTLGESRISPERQKELEFGIDTGFLENRINLEATYYVKTVDDLVLLANERPSSGFTSRWSNAGNLENKGIELTLNADLIRADKFNWNTNVLFFKNQSEITKLNVDAFNLGGFGQGLGTFRIEEGKSATQIVGNNANGDLVVLGNSEPDFQMTFTNKLSYKNLDLSFLWHWKSGGDNINLTNLLTDFGQTSPDYDDTTLDPSGALTNGDFRIASFRGGNATPFVEDASYLRMREVGLYYSFTDSMLKQISKGQISNVRVGLSGNNLINIFDYNSYDPEVSNFGSNGLSTGVEVTPFPSSKRYMLHLLVDF